MVSQKTVSGMNGGGDAGVKGSLVNPASVLLTISLAIAEIALTAPAGTSAYQPPDVGGPAATTGSGTR